MNSIYQLLQLIVLRLMACLVLTLPASAEDDLSSLNISSPTRFAVTVSPLTTGTSRITLGTSDDVLFPPASTLKLLTASAALLELGTNFTFVTAISRANDDVIIHFSGDPTFTSKDLAELLSKLKPLGMTQIKGDIWLNNSIFTGYETAVGWPWDALGVCYSAPSSTITLDGNCIPGSIYTQADGATRVYIPEQYPIVVTTKADSVTSEQQQQRMCDLELNATQYNQYQLNGCLVSRSRPLPLMFAIRNTALYAREQVTNLLHQQGITLSGTIHVGAPPNTPTQIIAIKRSVILNQLVKTMLQDSDNLIANNLTKMIGHHYYQQPGNFSNGTAAIKAILSKHGINLTTAQLYDGSGLSRNNRLSLKQILDVLSFIAKNDDQLHLLSSLAVAGESGTLKYRSSMRNAPIKGHIIGKSGSLYGTHNMAGFGLDKSGKPATMFVQLITDYFPDKDDTQKPSELEQFERTFYSLVVEKASQQ